jgi:hypothetical protein
VDTLGFVDCQAIAVFVVLGLAGFQDIQVIQRNSLGIQGSAGRVDSQDSVGYPDTAGFLGSVVNQGTQDFVA